MKVLFIGNSHTYSNDMPALFASMCSALCGETPEVTMLAYSGRTLRWHRREYFPVRFALLYGQYDYCVIQQLGHPFPGLHETEPYVEALTKLCRSVGTKPVLYMTWAKKREPEAFFAVRDAYRTLAERYDTLLAPAGELFDLLNRTHPEIDLYGQDERHASSAGCYLIAATLACCMLRPDNLDALSDTSYDFSVPYGTEELPAAKEDRAAIPITLPAEHAAVIRKAIEELLMK